MYSISVSESVNPDAVMLENLNPELVEKAMRFLLSEKDLTGFKFYTSLNSPKFIKNDENGHQQSYFGFIKRLHKLD
jgi:pyridoxine/pyridoxamine 5'-phosphate oxidase